MKNDEIRITSVQNGKTPRKKMESKFPGNMCSVLRRTDRQIDWQIVQNHFTTCKCFKLLLRTKENDVVSKADVTLKQIKFARTTFINLMNQKL